MSSTSINNPVSDNTDLVSLWTIQDAACWNLAVSRGVLRADGRRVWREFREPYAWMREQMCARIGPSTRYPVWAWMYPRPTTKVFANFDIKPSDVLVEFRMPKSDVLLSLFEEWHFVLNFDYLAFSEDEYEDFHARFPRMSWINGSPEYRKEVRDSWKAIFDLISADTPRPWIQATMWEIPLTAVTSVVWPITI